MSDVSNFESMVKEFKDFADLKAYSNAQYNTIIELNKQITKLKAETQHVQVLLDSLPARASNGLITQLVMSPEEEICLAQLQVLNDISKRGQLTLEEARKTEIYAKILNSIRAIPKDIKGEHSNIDTAELLKLAEGIVNDPEAK